MRRHRQGGTQGRPPEMGKIAVEKMMLFPKALFLATTFPKKLKTQFSIEFLSKIFNMFSKVPNKLYISSKLAKN